MAAVGVVALAPLATGTFRAFRALAPQEQMGRLTGSWRDKPITHARPRDMREMSESSAKWGVACHPECLEGARSAIFTQSLIGAGSC